LLQLRGELAILQDLKLGPILGRGSFGRVHKARWKAAVVAVKIIEQHGEGGLMSSGGKVLSVGRESLLATAMSHPNVVQTYHISTMTVGERVALAQKLRRNKESSRERLLQQDQSAALPPQVRRSG
jgi:serine/threonine protein kinase